jgi:hypothetical protein
MKALRMTRHRLTDMKTLGRRAVRSKQKGTQMMGHKLRHESTKEDAP